MHNHSTLPRRIKKKTLIDDIRQARFRFKSIVARNPGMKHTDAKKLALNELMVESRFLPAPKTRRHWGFLMLYSRLPKDTFDLMIKCLRMKFYRNATEASHGSRGRRDHISESSHVRPLRTDPELLHSMLNQLVSQQIFLDGFLAGLKEKRAEIFCKARIVAYGNEYKRMHGQPEVADWDTFVNQVPALLSVFNRIFPIVQTLTFREGVVIKSQAGITDQMRELTILTLEGQPQTYDSSAFFNDAEPVSVTLPTEYGKDRAGRTRRKKKPRVFPNIVQKQAEALPSNHYFRYGLKKGTQSFVFHQFDLTKSLQRTAFKVVPAGKYCLLISLGVLKFLHPEMQKKKLKLGMQSLKFF